MIEFVQSYGLWIALIGVFVAMHWFGMGCCGGRHRQGQGSEGVPGQARKEEKPSETAHKSSGSCH